ncbi:hypothetical protein BDW75DRAFT_41877 [Aspergillus navahoensis]
MVRILHMMRLRPISVHEDGSVLRRLAFEFDHDPNEDPEHVKDYTCRWPQENGGITIVNNSLYRVIDSRLLYWLEIKANGLWPDSAFGIGVRKQIDMFKGRKGDRIRVRFVSPFRLDLNGKCSGARQQGAPSFVVCSITAWVGRIPHWILLFLLFPSA